MSPMLPSWIRSSSGTPDEEYARAMLITSRRLASTRRRLASMSPRSLRRASSSSSARVSSAPSPIWRTYVCSRSTAGAGASVRSSSSTTSGESNSGCAATGAGACDSSLGGAGVTGSGLSVGARRARGRRPLPKSIGVRAPSLEGQDAPFEHLPANSPIGFRGLGDAAAGLQAIGCALAPPGDSAARAAAEDQGMQSCLRPPPRRASAPPTPCASAPAARTPSFPTSPPRAGTATSTSAAPSRPSICCGSAPATTAPP